jgi:hypothetical protein
MDLSVLPFSLQLPSGYSLAAGGSPIGSTAPNTAAGATASVPADVVSISNSFDAGRFTAAGGDLLNLSALLQGVAGKSGGILAYRVALGAGGGQLQLDGKDVSEQTSFTADQFARLNYITDVQGTQQSLVVVAQSGTLLPDGTLSQEVDSPAVQITADVTGSRSINAMNALRTIVSGTAANIKSIVQQAGIFTGFAGSTRPVLRTDGNFTAAAGDTYRLSDLFKASAANGQAITGYRLALGDGAGQLWLDGKDVTTRTDFTAADFAHLTYVTDVKGSQQSLLVLAQTGALLPGGALSHEVDSAAVQITVDVTDSRSINAMNALVTTPSGADVAITSLAQQAGIFSGFAGTTRPTLQTDGNFSAAAGDVYRMSDLFKASGAKGQTIIGYRVALGEGGGHLWLNGKDVTTQIDFTAADFAHLTYATDVKGTQQSLLVLAQTGTLLPGGALSHEVDSAAVQITVDVTDSRSINAMDALVTVPVGSDAGIGSIVQQAGIFTGFAGKARPVLQTDGNFAAAAGDTYRVGDLFRASAAKGETITGYRLALGNGAGRLWLDGKDVTGQTDFTADDFAHLTYVTGAKDTRQSLVVLAQTGTLLPGGALSHEVDSAALQITVDVTDQRSINAMHALVTVPSGADANIASMVQQAGIFTGFTGVARPVLQTDGNFTAAAGDSYRLSDLFKASIAKGQTITGYRLALGAGAGQLWLDGKDVTTQTDFTAADFAHLTYTAGVKDTQQSLLVVAQSGTLLPGGVLSHEVDSAAVQITASVSDRRSINAMNALATVPSAQDADFVGIVQQAGIFTGFVGTGRASVQTSVVREPGLSLAALETITGAFRSAGGNQVGTETDLSPLYASAIGSMASPGALSDPGDANAAALLLLDRAATGAFRTSGSVSTQVLAIKAYNTAKGL